ncbi:hyaluronoglucosaminidase [Streptomyces sp. NPDC001315]|uniref:hyaluronoglucosaminidase n=1 Tax=Streptomyces sp. NPDC001315 TaxID=3364562 RepID=UPI0036C372C3
MALGRRVFLGGFTAGAVTVVAGGADAAAADSEYTLYASPAQFYSTSTTAHTVTINQKATSGDVAALNVTSDNPATSAVYVTGVETGRGTVKVSHMGYADGSDANASALSIDLRTTGATTEGGTAAQGIYLTATTGPTKGNLIALRNNTGLDDFIVKGTGRIGVGIDRAATPRAQLHVVQRADAPAALLVEGVARIGNVATAPTSVDTTAGGGALYAENGALKWRGSSGTVTTIARA